MAFTTGRPRNPFDDDDGPSFGGGRSFGGGYSAERQPNRRYRPSSSQSAL